MVMDASDIKSDGMFFMEMNLFLGFDYSNSFQNNNYNTGNDSLVLIQTKPTLAPMMSHSKLASILIFAD